MSNVRDAWIEIDHASLVNNLAHLEATSGAPVCAVVKANAYGHGAVSCAHTLIEAGAQMLAVITLDEAIQLRESGVEAPILLLHEARKDRVQQVIDHQLTPSVFTSAYLDALSAAASPGSIGIHLKVDTGLNRLGVPWRELSDFVEGPLRAAPGVDVAGVFTHLAFADEPANPVIDLQLSRFADSLDLLKAAGIEPQIRHAANSAASLARPDACFDMIRPGVALYGLSPGPQVPNTAQLRPVLSLKARVAMVKRVPAGDGVSYAHRFIAERDTTIATLPLGYADGWSRALTNNAQVLIGGSKHPAVGTVTMDSITVDVGDSEVSIGDEAVLIGSQGELSLTADQIAERLGTINYEIVTRLSNRLPRVDA